MGGVQFKGMHVSVGDAPGIGADVDGDFLAGLENVVI
jgi:hypothetical protein